MMDLTVEIEGDIGSLEEALRKFTSTETLDGENKYHCSRLDGGFFIFIFILHACSVLVLLAFGVGTYIFFSKQIF